MINATDSKSIILMLSVSIENLPLHFPVKALTLSKISVESEIFYTHNFGNFADVIGELYFAFAPSCNSLFCRPFHLFYRSCF